MCVLDVCLLYSIVMVSITLIRIIPTIIVCVFNGVRNLPVIGSGPYVVQ